MLAWWCFPQIWATGRFHKFPAFFFPICAGFPIYMYPLVINIGIGNSTMNEFINNFPTKTLIYIQMSLLNPNSTVKSQTNLHCSLWKIPKNPIFVEDHPGISCGTVLPVLSRIPSLRNSSSTVARGIGRGAGCREFAGTGRRSRCRGGSGPIDQDPLETQSLRTWKWLMKWPYQLFHQSTISGKSLMFHQSNLKMAIEIVDWNIVIFHIVSSMFTLEGTLKYLNKMNIWGTSIVKGGTLK